MKRPLLGILLALIGGCTGDGVASHSDYVVDVEHTPAERQSIGNCWLYAAASWSESLHKARTGYDFDISQSYWTFWDWYLTITEDGEAVLETGGSLDDAMRIIRERGLMAEEDFVPEDASGERSQRQADALYTMGKELTEGRLREPASRQNHALVLEVLKDAWKLDEGVRDDLYDTFGYDGQRTFENGKADERGDIRRPDLFAVQYRQRISGQDLVVETDLAEASETWHEVGYAKHGSACSGDDCRPLAERRRDTLIRVQRALHVRQPVGVVWNVDFNALERKEGPLYGSFNLTTLAAKGKPGGQGGHITVLDDYQVQLPSGAFLQAGDTLDPIDDADLLAAALLPESRIMFLRIKNSWGELRPDYPFARGMPGHHDLYMDYLDGPIAWCKEAEAKPNAVDEFDDDGPKLDCEPVAPLRTFWLPPGY